MVNRPWNFASLATEKANPATREIDRVSLTQSIELILGEDRKIARAVQQAKGPLSKAVLLISNSLRQGGRLFFVGAGTSGRLGVLEAAECPPTFNTPPSLVQAIMAGGPKAVFHSQEGAEDRGDEAARQISQRVRPGDVVVGIAASGVTPFVGEALKQAKQLKARTVLVTCNPHPPRKQADIVIAAYPGPEVISGSTRLKAGTCTKMMLNILTTATMIRLGKVYGHWMVDLQPKSKKLQARALRLVMHLGEVDEKNAGRLIKEAHGHAKTAILMARAHLSAEAAVSRLKKHQGFLRRALNHGGAS